MLDGAYQEEEEEGYVLVRVNPVYDVTNDVPLRHLTPVVGEERSTIAHLYQSELAPTPRVGVPMKKAPSLYPLASGERKRPFDVRDIARLPRAFWRNFYGVLIVLFIFLMTALALAGTGGNLG